MMAVSASQCYQVARCHIRPHYDGIWVSDSLLASAFARYAAISRTFARYGSAVPGPMEHKKRLKRHMGGLHFGQSHAAAPIWELANLADLTQWKWLPPTLPNVKKRQNVSATELRTLSDPAPGSAPLRSPPFPCTDPTAEHRNLSEPLLPADTTLNSVAEPLLPSSWRLGCTPLDVIDTSLMVLSQDISQHAEDMPLFAEFCSRWRQALGEGRFRGEAIGKVLSGIADGLNVESLRINRPRVVDHLKLVLIEATIEGLSMRTSENITSFDHVAWNDTLHGVSTIQMNTIRVFTRAMACVPESCIESVSPGILVNLDAYFNALGRVVKWSAKRATITRQATKMAIPLRPLGQPELRFVLDHATQLILKYTHAEGVNSPYVRFSWLQLIARLPDVDISYLSQVCVALEPNSAFGLLREYDICKLFLVWANIQTPLAQYVRLRDAIRNRRLCYDPLAKQLWHTQQYHRARQLGLFLDEIGRESGIRWLVKGVLESLRWGVRNLANMALGIRKPRMAIDILCLYEESRRCKKPFWQSQFGFKALEMLVWTPNFNHKKFWRVLKFHPRQEFRSRLRKRKVQEIQSGRIAMTAAVAIVVGLSPHIGRRTSFAFITDCYVYLRRRYAKLPRAFLRALVRNVTTLVKTGRPVVISRLRYVVYILEREMGKENAEPVALALQQWHLRHKQQHDRLGNDRL